MEKTNNIVDVKLKEDEAEKKIWLDLSMKKKNWHIDRQHRV